MAERDADRDRDRDEAKDDSHLLHVDDATATVSSTRTRSRRVSYVRGVVLFPRQLPRETC